MALSPLGHRQAQALSAWLGDTKLHAVYASPMQRVRQTMAPLLARRGMEATIMEDLREIDFGAWTGLSWDEVQARHGVSAFTWLNQIEDGTIERAETIHHFHTTKIDHYLLRAR